MKIKLLKTCLIGGQHCDIGEVVDVDDRDGTYLVNTRAAELSGKGGKAKKTTVKSVRIRMVRACMVGGKHVEAGKVVSVSEADARYLIPRGIAVEFTAKAKADDAESDADDAGNDDAEAES